MSNSKQNTKSTRESGEKNLKFEISIKYQILKMNVTAKSKWKSVPLDAQLMARGFSEGLMGIEELSSYDLVQVKKKTSGTGTSNGKVTKVEGSKIISGKNALKRPLNVEGEEIEEEPKKKKKTRQKRKPKKKVPKGIKPDQSSKNESVINDKELHIQLPGWKDFSVPQPVLRALKELGFEEPTPIQRSSSSHVFTIPEFTNVFHKNCLCFVLLQST
mgnify:CR=1 FL=1